MTKCSFVPTDGHGLRKILILGASEDALRQHFSGCSGQTSHLGGPLQKSLWQRGSGAFVVRM